MRKLFLNQIAKRFKLSEAAIRFYDEKGEIDLPWIEMIVCLKKTGMTIKDIKQYIDIIN